ncbi:MAG: ParB/RepB/Spo0J family partition protein [Candidatus Eisenbacteria bacterium]|nr:ParB/RepB/Spo0J family partition protein [Candidatus Eisenbacteria bacterium]
MPKPRASLRGLGARLQAEAAEEATAHPLDALPHDFRQMLNIPLDAITPNPDQVRKHFDSQALDDLAQSIREHGLLQPVIVKRAGGDGYILVAGERRYRAARAVGMRKIPALITNGNELELAIVENLQRENLRPIEEAEAFQALADRFRYTQEQLAAVVGKSRVSVAESLALLDLPDEMKRECRTSDIASKSQLLHIVRERDAQKRHGMWEAVKEGRLTVREARKQRGPKARAGRPKHHVETIKLDDPAAVVTVRFSKATANRDEVLRALERAMERVREGKK